MAVISNRRELQLIRFETIIKRCPICLKDTEQIAYYAKDPNLSMTAMTPTLPESEVRVNQELEHGFQWHVLAKCSSCGYTYRVMGVPRMQVKNINEKPKSESVNLALICCDICYNELHRYAVSSVFINLSEGHKVYLCQSHADEVEAHKKEDGSYKYIINKQKAWHGTPNKREAIVTKYGTILLNRFNGMEETILLSLSKHANTPIEEIIAILDKRAQTSNAKKQANNCIDYLSKELGLVNISSEGTLLKKKSISLTEKGEAVAELLRSDK